MSLQSLQDYTFVSRYARHDPLRGRRETWDEAVDRVRQMHRRRYPAARAAIDEAFALVLEKRVLGSQRALQFGGAPIEGNHARLYNCTASFCDRLRFFQEAFWLTLCGCGVGFSVQEHHVARLPAFARRSGRRSRKTFLVPDSVEGWANALGALLSSYFADPVFSEFAGCDVRFDYHLLEHGTADRIEGASVRRPEGRLLQHALETIRRLLDRCLERGQTRLRPIDAYDIVMHTSDAVSGTGVRRSATICVFSPDDHEMLAAKTGNWVRENPQRARSNNSCLLLRHATTREQFRGLLQYVREFGEPGFIWADSTEYLVNPCCEIGMWPVDEATGESGWQFCNLTEINGALIRTRDDLARAARAAAHIGTWQAGYTDFPYLGPVSERITRREALLGVSITGIMENPDLLLDPAVQREAAELVKAANAEMARQIGINPAARTTCVKPSGTSSCLLGTSAGIHPHHGRRYFRRVQAGKGEAAQRRFAEANPEAVEESVWSPLGTDVVLTFCVEPRRGALTKDDLTAVEFLECVRSTQQNWVLPGTRPERCTRPWLTHNVSNTVVVRDGEWPAVTDLVFDRRDCFTGVSMLPDSGDRDYAQAPLCAVLTLDEIASAYGAGWRPAARLIARAGRLFHGGLHEACEALTGSGGRRSPAGTSARRRWLLRAGECAARHFGNDRRKLCTCMKDLANLALWRRLKAAYRPVDYDGVAAEEDGFFVHEPACAGGACLV